MIRPIHRGVQVKAQLLYDLFAVLPFDAISPSYTGIAGVIATHGRRQVKVIYTTRSAQNEQLHGGATAVHSRTLRNLNQLLPQPTGIRYQRAVGAG